MPFATTLYNDINNKNLVQNIKFRSDTFQKHYLKDVFQNVHIVLAQQHPKNMVRALTNFFFHSNNSIQLIQNEVQTAIQKQKTRLSQWMLHITCRLLLKM